MFIIVKTRRDAAHMERLHQKSWISNCNDGNRHYTMTDTKIYFVKYFY